MASSPRDGSKKLVVDSIHGGIQLRDREIQVIDTASFQRLRQLRQLAMAQMVYPTATHTRFAHSIGALGAMIRILQVAKDNGIKFEPEQEDNFRLAALLHDIGHYPYSHLMEKIEKVKLIEGEVDGASSGGGYSRVGYPEHEEVGMLIVTNQSDLVKAIGSRQRAKAVSDIFTRTSAAYPQLSKLIKSSFDLDRWDYLLRDAYATGVPYGHIDINYLLNNLKVSPEGMVGFSNKALPAVEHLLLARFFMYRTVYFHKTIYGMEETCRQLLRRLRDRDGKHYGVPIDGEGLKKLVISRKLNTFTDAFVDNVIRKAVTDKDKVIKALARSIQSRKPPKLLKEVQICEEPERKYHAGKTFMQNCRTKLNDLANEFKIPLEQFLLCELKVPVVKRPQWETYGRIAKLKPEDIRKKASEQEEEDIKIFTGDDPEPVSLLQIEHSLVAKCAKYSLQIFRLYVVYEGENRDNVAAQLHDRVKNWHKP